MTKIIYIYNYFYRYSDPQFKISKNYFYMCKIWIKEMSLSKNMNDHSFIKRYYSIWWKINPLVLCSDTKDTCNAWNINETT